MLVQKTRKNRGGRREKPAATYHTQGRGSEYLQVTLGGGLVALVGWVLLPGLTPGAGGQGRGADTGAAGVLAGPGRRGQQPALGTLPLNTAPAAPHHRRVDMGGVGREAGTLQVRAALTEVGLAACTARIRTSVVVASLWAGHGRLAAWAAGGGAVVTWQGVADHVQTHHGPPTPHPTLPTHHLHPGSTTPPPAPPCYHSTDHSLQ